MLQRFRQFAEDQDLYHSGDRVLLAVSGGVDSVVLVRLAMEAGWLAGIAHCNFQLRGAASDGDEDFVRDLAAGYGIPVFVEVFDAAGEAGRRGVSVQMAARELRYEWLEKVRRAHHYDWVALAHHLNDSIETVFYNFAKGTGIRGLHGIPVRRDQFIRPLLFATKEEIVAYAERQGLSFREDTSNYQDKYARNKIRHHVIPVFRKLNPAFEQTAAANIRHIQEAEYLFEYALRRIGEELIRREGDRHYLDLDRLLAHYKAAPTILFELLRPFHFNAGQVAQILESAGRQPGGLFYSETHQLLVDRDALIIEARYPDQGPSLFLIRQGAERVYLPDGTLHLVWGERQPDHFPKSPYKAVLDVDLTHFPLRLRHWQPGDVFCPLGMGGKHQKLQDFFTNNKIPRLDKDRIWLLETGDRRICWVIGHRLDERFRITDQTNGYLSLDFELRND